MLLILTIAAAPAEELTFPRRTRSALRLLARSSSLDSDDEREVFLDTTTGILHLLSTSSPQKPLGELASLDTYTRGPLSVYYLRRFGCPCLPRRRKLLILSAAAVIARSRIYRCQPPALPHQSPPTTVIAPANSRYPPWTVRISERASAWLLLVVVLLRYITTDIARPSEQHRWPIAIRKSGTILPTRSLSLQGFDQFFRWSWCNVAVHGC
jgi:hypothetical protein